MAVPTVVTVTGSASSTGGTPGNWPTTSDDDIVILTLNLTNSTTPAATPPGGSWNNLSDITVGTTSGNEILMKTVWKRVAASEAAPTFTSITGYRFWQTVLLRGCITSGDFFELNNTATGEATTAVTITDGTTTYTDQLMVYVLGTELSGSTGWLSSATNANLTNLTEQYDLRVTGGSGNGRGCYTGELATPGAAGTFDVTGAASSNWVMMSFSVLSSDSVIPGGGTMSGRKALLGVGV